MKILITGGGTGGHIYPALAIAKRIKEDYSYAKILYVGTKTGMEADLVPKEGIDFKAIRVKGFTRKISLDTIKSVKELVLGLNDAKKVINDFKPDLVIGTGGYVCGPIVLIAALKKIPTMIHEQNAFPGVTNRILSRFVDRIAGSFEESKNHFKNTSKLVITGNPIRKDIINVNKNLAYKDLNINKNIPFILSFGGSGGQKKLNDSIMEVIKLNQSNEDIQILHVTGKRHYENFIKGLKDKGVEIKDSKNIKVIPYLFEMPKAQSIADIIITSGGAISISEITAMGVPSIIIPKAYTTDNHQEFNARALDEKGAGVMVLEKDLSGQKLNTLIWELLRDENRLNIMARNSKKLGKIDATDKIMDIINELV